MLLKPSFKRKLDRSPRERSPREKVIIEENETN